MWDLVSSLLKEPQRLKAGLEEMIERERAGLRGDPDQEAKTWLARLSEVDQERRGYLRLAAKGRLTDEELDEALAELEATRETAERELRATFSTGTGWRSAARGRGRPASMPLTRRG